MNAPRRWGGQAASPIQKKYHPPRIIDDVWCMEVEDGYSREITVRRFANEIDAQDEYTRLTVQQHWDRKRQQRNRSR